MLFNQARPVAPGTPYFLAPGPILGRDDNTFDLHGRQSPLGAAFVGPQWSGWQTGGQVLAVFYNDNVIADESSKTNLITAHLCCCVLYLQVF